MEYKIVDDYLPIDQYQNIADEIVKNNNFPLYVLNGVSGFGKADGYYFMHLMYDNGEPRSNKLPLISPFLNKMEWFAIRRIKVNFYPTTKEIQKHGWHVDYKFPHKGAIYYLNTNDGKTILEDGTEIDSVANRMLFFDPSIKHRSTTCTNDSHGRYNINFNFV